MLRWWDNLENDETSKESVGISGEKLRMSRQDCNIIKLFIHLRGPDVSPYLLKRHLSPSPYESVVSPGSQQFLLE